MKIYQQNGYNSRVEYLTELSKEYRVPYETVYALWEILGDEESFDGLVTEVQGASEWIG